MNANELKAKARERLAEIAKQRAALDAEEREIRVMLGDVPPAPTVVPFPLPLPYGVHQVLPPGFEPYIVAREEAARSLSDSAITSRTTGCAVPA